MTSIFITCSCSGQYRSNKLHLPRPGQSLVLALRRGRWDHLVVPLPVFYLIRIDTVLLNIAPVINQDVFVVMNAFTGAHSYDRIVHSRQTDRLDDQMVTARAIAHIHIEWRGRCALFLIAIDVEPVHMGMRATKQQLFHCRDITVKIYKHWCFGSEECRKQLIVQAMRVCSIAL